jgi:hypothetical protein
MPTKPKLSLQMTPQQFENGYWYAAELRSFAKSASIPHAGRLRKDQLEAAILELLAAHIPSLSGARLQRAASTFVSMSGPSTSSPPDSDRGLHLDLPVVRFRNDPQTWDFIERESRKLSPGMKRRSGAKYRLNRWRDAQLASGHPITYADLIAEYVRLSTAPEPFKPIPHGRYINFARDYFAHEKGATFQSMLRAWKQVKKLDAPKDYRSWAALSKRVDR